MIHLHLGVRVHPGGGDRLVEFLRDAIPFYERPGGIRMRLLRCHESPDEFIEVVEYDDTEVFERDRLRVASDPAMREVLARWRSLLASGPEVLRYDDVTPR